MRALALAALVLVASCASFPPAPGPDGFGAQAALHAEKMVGRPYRHAGATPAGFDCSGLVHYAYREAGMKVPRDTGEQLAASRRIPQAELRPGDLLFFDQDGRRNSHVGVYLGEGRFVHAPSSGKSVRTDRLDNAYWRRHLSDMRRFDP